MKHTIASILILMPCIVTAANDRTYRDSSEEPPCKTVAWSKIRKSENPSAALRSYFGVTTDSSSVLAESTHNQQTTCSEATSMGSISDSENSDAPYGTDNSDTESSHFDDTPSAQKKEYRPINDILKHASSLTKCSKKEAQEIAEQCMQLSFAGKRKEADGRSAAFHATKAKDAIDYLLPIANNAEYVDTLKKADKAMLYTDIGCYYQLMINEKDNAKHFLALGAALGNIRAEQRLKALSNPRAKVSAV